MMLTFVLLAAWALLSADVYASSTPNAVCATAKLKAAAQKMAAKLKCQTSAIKGARAVDVACLLKAEQKFAAAFVKAEAKGGCVMSGDADVVESHVDGGVSTLVADEPGGPESQWVPLIGRSWTMPAGSEAYRCRRIQLQSDMYITGFRPVSTSTVFTMTVSVSSTSTPLGDYNCSPNNIDQRVIYESGLGANDLEFPLGVGVHLHAGDYVNVNLSLDNEGTKAADGFAGVLVRTGSAASVINNAGLVLAGTFSISIPNDGMPHTANGGCPWHSENQVVALWPHLHARGTHVSMLIAPAASTPQTVIDAPYAIDHQPIIPAALALHPGDNVGVTCTYVNNTQTNPLVFGDSPQASEQCFVGMYVWPSEGLSVFDCVSN
jgi:hypothetical protein